MALPAGLAGIGWALMKQGGIDISRLSDSSLAVYNMIKKGEFLQTLKSFVAAYGDTPYGPIAREHEQALLSELDAVLTEIASLQNDDPYQAARRILEADKEYLMCSIYKNRVAPIKQAMSSPEISKHKQIGTPYYRLLAASERNPADSSNRKKLEKFAKTYPDSVYAKMATDAAARMP